MMPARQTKGILLALKCLSFDSKEKCLPLGVLNLYLSFGNGMKTLQQLQKQCQYDSSWLKSGSLGFQYV